MKRLSNFRLFFSRALPTLLLTVVALAHLNSIWGVFVLDDVHHILENSAVQNFHLLSIQSWNTLLHAPINQARPVVTLSLAFNHLLSGLNPWSYHAVNLLAHLTAVALLGILLSRFFERSLAWWAAALWGVHPLTTSAVTYTIQRGEVFMAVFSLAYFWAHLQALQEHRHTRAAVKWLVAANLFLLGALGSKEVALVTPLILAAAHQLKIIPPLSRSLRNTSVAFTLATLALAVLYYSGTPHNPGGALGSGVAWSVWEYFRTQPLATLRYLSLLVWPLALSLDPGWLPALRWIEIYPPLLLWCAAWCWIIYALVVQAPYRARVSWAPFAALFYLAYLFPSSSFFVISDIAFDHRAYLSSAAVIAALVLFFKPSTRLLVILMLLASGFTLHRNWQMGSQSRISEDLLRKAPLSPRVIKATAEAYEQQSNWVAAETFYQRLQAIRPDARSWADLCNFYYRRQKITQAIDACTHAYHYYRDDTLVRSYLGALHFQAGELATASRYFKEATQLDQRQASHWANLVHVALKQGQVPLAAEYALEAQKRLEFTPESRPQAAQAAEALGREWVLRGQAHAALKWLEFALAEPNPSLDTLQLATWIWSTHPSSAVRNPKKAAELASRLPLDQAVTRQVVAAAATALGQYDNAIQLNRSSLWPCRNAHSPEAALCAILKTRAQLIETGIRKKSAAIDGSLER